MKTHSPEVVSNLARALDIGALLLAFTLSAWLAAGEDRKSVV